VCAGEIEVGKTYEFAPDQRAVESRLAGRKAIVVGYRQSAIYDVHWPNANTSMTTPSSWEGND
jgi:hypothetical protein